MTLALSVLALGKSRILSIFRNSDKHNKISPIENSVAVHVYFVIDTVFYGYHLHLMSPYNITIQYYTMEDHVTHKCPMTAKI